MAIAPLTPLLFVAAFVAATPLTETQFVASASPTHFAATNPNDFSVLMLLGDVAYGARAQMLVAPYAAFETSFPSGTLDELYIEVVFFTPTGTRSSGAVSFDTMMAAQADLLEVESTGDEFQPWISSGGTRMPADSGVLLAPSWLLDPNNSSSLPLMLEPTHVPVLTPEDTEDDTWAPKIHGTNPII
jgi:hypothetical protein